LDKEITIDSGKFEYKTAFRKIDRFEPGWLYNLRRLAWEFYLDSPLPERTANVWRYTDPANFILENPERLFDFLPVNAANMPQKPRDMDLGYAALGYNRGDLATFTQLSPELADSGIVFEDLYVAARDDSTLVEKYFGKIVGHDFGKFEALNMALWNTGLFLYIPANATIEKPIYLHRHPTGMVTIPRLLVVIGENSQATIIDDYACHCHHDGAITNSAVEIFGGMSSNTQYVNIQRLADGAKTLITSRAQVEQGANIKSIFSGTGSATTKVNAGAILNGRGANSQMYGVIFGDANQHFDYHTSQHHVSGESFSNLNFKVVLKDNSMSAYTGLIRIEKYADNCEAYQENRNLLLNKGTKAESIPELEILTDQVRCTHGATMGPIDPEMVFYLMSRGISQDEAVKAIVSGYIEPLLKQLPGDLAQMLRELTKNKLGDEIHAADIH
jgi:Fe-S cluster assembly protein SufD